MRRIISICFSLLIVLVCIFVAKNPGTFEKITSTFSEHSKEKLVVKCESPKTGDIYCLDFKEILSSPEDEYFKNEKTKEEFSSYTYPYKICSMKLDKIEGETLTFIMGDYVGEDAESATRSVNFNQETVEFSQKTLKSYIEKRYIVAIMR